MFRSSNTHTDVGGSAPVGAGIRCFVCRAARTAGQPARRPAARAVRAREGLRSLPRRYPLSTFGLSLAVRRGAEKGSCSRESRKRAELSCAHAKLGACFFERSQECRGTELARLCARSGALSGRAGSSSAGSCTSAEVLGREVGARWRGTRPLRCVRRWRCLAPAARGLLG